MRSVSLIVSFLLSILSAANGVTHADQTNPVCIIKTSMGDVHVELFADEAPKTVKNFELCS